MRMWGVDPRNLCNQHLLGEHVEMHMFAGTICLGKSIDGYIEKGLVNPALIVARHDLLAGEMRRRGMNHQSPISLSNNDLPLIPIDIDANEIELRKRCRKCYPE